MAKYIIQSWIRRDPKVGLVQDGISVHTNRANVKEMVDAEKKKGGESMPHGTPFPVAIKKEDYDLDGVDVRLDKKEGMAFMKRHGL
jgi:hypothetical protein